MKVKEKLKDEFCCAIAAVLGDLEDLDVSEYEITGSDIDTIAKKVKFYLDL